MDSKNTLIILSPGFAANEEDTTCLPPQQVFVKALNKNFPSLQIIILAFQYPLVKKNYRGFGNEIISFNGADKGKFSKKNHLKHVCWILGQDAKKENIYVGWIKPAPDELIALSDFIADTFFKN